MVSVLKLQAGDDDTEGVLALRIDVVAAAVALVGSWPKGDLNLTDECEEKLGIVVRRYKAALRRRERLLNTRKPK